MVSERIARSASAWALPRPSAIASAKLPNTTVSHRKNATVKVNHAGPSLPVSQITVVTAAPTSTTNMTGLRATCRGSSLTSDDSIADTRMSRCSSERSGRSVIAEPG